MGSFLRLINNKCKNVLNSKAYSSLFNGRLAHSIRESHSLKNEVRTIQVNAKNNINFSGQQRLSLCTKPYDIDTNVAKDVILYKYENPKYFKHLNIFATILFLCWSSLSYNAYKTLKDAGEEKEVKLKWLEHINLGEKKYRIGITIVTFLVGYCILVAAWMFTLRSVRFLILRKGGQNITLVTYTPLGHNRIMTVPLKCISAQQPREIARVLLPLKVRDRALFYVLDMKGEFKNAKLYDFTAGINRRF